MPCRSSVAAPQSFPADFTVDTDPFRAALAEHHWQRYLAGFPQVSFLELPREEQSKVLTRAQEFKDAPPARWTFLAAEPTPEQPAEPDPWPIVAFAWLAVQFDRLLTCMRRVWWI